MTISAMLKEKKLSQYALAKRTGLSQSSISDICNGKIALQKCTGETLYKLAKALDTSVDKLLEPAMTERIPFELFKSNVCHRLKREGDIDFLINAISNNEVIRYYELEWYPECFYMLAMIDYLSKLNDIPIVEEYDNIRKLKLSERLYPDGLLAMAYFQDAQNILPIEQYLERFQSEWIPEFLKYNIVEKDVREVV